MPKIETTSVTTPITKDNLPIGLRFEADGACWRCILDEFEPKGWRWQPANWKAFAKDGPDGELSDIPPGTLVNFERKDCQMVSAADYDDFVAVAS